MPIESLVFGVSLFIYLFVHSKYYFLYNALDISEDWIVNNITTFQIQLN